MRPVSRTQRLVQSSDKRSSKPVTGIVKGCPTPALYTTPTWRPTLARAGVRQPFTVAAIRPGLVSFYKPDAAGS